MKLTEFLTKAKTKSFWNDNRVICFSSDTYPLFFLQSLFAFVKKQKIVTLFPLHVADKKQLWETLEQSFLGATSFYWLGNVATKQLFAKKRGGKGGPDLVEVLSLYRGPHSIAFFLPNDHTLSTSARKRMMMVDLPGSLTRSEVQKVVSFFEMSLSAAKQSVLLDIATQGDSLSLDTICMLMQYLSVTGTRQIDSLRTSVASIIAPELSLFVLSSAFFKKQEKTFFSIWSERCNDYPVPFWTVYWSEQLWRAYHVVQFLKQNNFPAARRFAFRLPASFLRYDWRQCSLSQLKGAYQMVYDIDFAFKTGGSVAQSSALYAFDLLYCKHFLSEFTNDL